MILDNMKLISFFAIVVALVRGDELEVAKRKTDEARKQFEAAMNRLRSDKMRFDEQAAQYRDKAAHERQEIRQHQLR
jgi:hypothetical protein